MSEYVAQQVAVIGLGYIGLPLAAAFGRVLPTLGFDIDRNRVRELQKGKDRNGETSEDKLRGTALQFTGDETALSTADYFIVAVPTPVDAANRPNLSALLHASRIVGRAIASKKSSDQGNGIIKDQLPVVIYESTVYPGCTEEVCIPALEDACGGRCGAAFTVGYSPERINPGDKEHTLERVVKIVAGRDAETTERVKRLYSLVVEAGIYAAPDIRTAEATKVVENIQRDQNIACVNELAMLLHRLGLNTQEVLKAARTKWNFLPFEPGLVGGHCIPVVPYYLAHKAQEAGYYPEMLLAGRRVNDHMARYLAHETVKLLAKNGRLGDNTKVLVLGLTFKENVPDVRNTRVTELIQNLEDFGIEAWVHEPLLRRESVQALGLRPVINPWDAQFHNQEYTYDAVVLAVPHNVFRKRSTSEYVRLLRSRSGSRAVLVDVKGVLDRTDVEHAGAVYWSL
jgi:UDP-N-acetyl-D-glucosamine/UDP-N-acetyl-D-galactosamine dehydrogenase